MSDSFNLAYTVHHKGKRYLAGTAADQIGPDAGEIGDHAWIGGKGPGKVTTEANPRAGVNAGSPRVPTASALPTPGPAPAAAPEPDGGDAGDGPRKAAGRRPATNS